MIYNLVLTGHPTPQLWSGISNLIPNYIQLKREDSNLDNDFGYDLDISENILEQLKNRARPEKISKCGKGCSHCGSRYYAAPIPPFLESWYLDHLRLLDQFPHRKRNQYHSNSTIETPDHHKKITKILLKCHIDVMDR